MNEERYNRVLDRISTLDERLAAANIMLARIDERVSAIDTVPFEQFQAVKQDVARIKRFALAAVIVLLLTGQTENVTHLIKLLVP